VIGKAPLDPAIYKPDAILKKAEEAWRNLGASVDPELVEVVARLLAFDPRERVGLGQALTELGTDQNGVAASHDSSHPSLSVVC
jgi:hypothetical protein